MMADEYARLHVTIASESIFNEVRCEGKLLPVYGVAIQTHAENDDGVVVIRVPLRFVEVEQKR
jgi:hypothetical protein